MNKAEQAARAADKAQKEAQIQAIANENRERVESFAQACASAGTAARKVAVQCRELIEALGFEMAKSVAYADFKGKISAAKTEPSRERWQGAYVAGRKAFSREAAKMKKAAEQAEQAEQAGTAATVEQAGTAATVEQAERAEVAATLQGAPNPAAAIAFLREKISGRVASKAKKNDALKCLHGLELFFDL